MRLIDADALRDRLQNIGYDDWNQGVTTTWAEAFKECADMVEEMPTIEPERKKGKWVIDWWNGEHVRRCSACNISQTVTVYKGKIQFRFCPYCGADMGEDGDK